ncbi:hypothetical protein DFH07DRAFT_949486 [Mycena maculata]|uniref:Uncharacterized protein n=1 Tax=Mycena maculata TaxID=230809 RepID=A0AAD7KAJ6_9AGAR|nr:hypothetical protein DFH07DRAFT_949486 [Mycena maculata]
MAATGVVAAGEGHRTLSWIWYSAVATENDSKLHEALQVEWLKPYSRAKRWREDLVTVEEEMRRTIEFGHFAERQWRERADARTSMLDEREKEVSLEVLEGVRAYALEHADQERRTCEALEKDWAPLWAKAALYLQGEESGDLQRVVVEVDLDQMCWVEAQQYEQEEVENDMYQ